MQKSYFIILSLILLCSSIPAIAQDKIVESSAKKTPIWIGMAAENYFTVSATAQTLEEAQKKCMADVKQYIITSIASNIVSTETSSSLQTSNNDVINLLELYSSTVKTQGASLPFLTDISISKAEEIYWAKYQVKKEKKTYYKYYIKYPFPANERRALIDEFLKIDREKYNKFLSIRNKFNTFTSIEDIETAITDLTALSVYFFDQTRKNEVETLITNYKNQYSNITIVPVSIAPGEYDFRLMLLGRVVKTAKKANLKSNCATQITITPIEDFYRITYDSENCIDDEENSLEIRYVFGGRSLNHSFPINVKETKMQIIPTGSIAIMIREIKGDSLKQKVTVSFNLRSGYDNSFSVEKVTLSIPELKDPLDSGVLTTLLKGKGNHILIFNLDIPVQITELPHSALSRGNIQLKNHSNKEVITIPLQLPYKINK